MVSRLMREIHELTELDRQLATGDLRGCVLQGLDLSGRGDGLARAEVTGLVVLGCRLPDAGVADLIGRGAVVFPSLPELPFNPYRSRLYDPGELFEVFDPGDPCSYCRTLDARIYRHWLETGRSAPPAILEALARRLHDHAITDALEELLVSARRAPVAIMGGHGMARGSGDYAAVARMARELSRRGFLVTSGGGPGAMEASHLGAYFAARDDGDLDPAISTLATAPGYRDRRWLAAAFEVRERFDPALAAPSLGIPTWTYGHEPPNPFATHIAKYFANSVREDGLLAIATGGVVFAPGSAGTIQEIFQDAAQNHYGTAGGRISPMALLGVEYWTERFPIMAVLERLSAGRPYAERIAISDDPDELVDFIAATEPLSVGGGWSFCAELCE